MSRRSGSAGRPRFLQGYDRGFGRMVSGQRLRTSSGGSIVSTKEALAARKVVRCSCGLEFKAPGMASEAERHLIQAVKRHAKDAHDLDFGDEQVLAMIEVVA